MSAVKSSKVQVGISTNPDNNFVIDASQTDGTLKISRGNIGATTQTVLEIPAIEGAVSRTLFRTAKNTTSGTFVDFSPSDSTGIPPWARKITVIFDGVSLSGVNVLMVQLGSSAGFLTSGYVSTGAQTSNAATPTAVSISTGLAVSGNNSPSDTRYGHMILTKTDGDLWIASSVSPLGNTTSVGTGGGRISLSGVLDRLRITSFGGTDTFDGGNVSLLIEG